MSKIEKALEKAIQQRSGQHDESIAPPLVKEQRHILEKALEKEGWDQGGTRPGIPVNKISSSQEQVEPVSVPPIQSSKMVAVHNVNPNLKTLVDSGSAIAEEYRKLKSILVKLTRDEGFRNTLMVASALPEEGKTTTALNLAISLAQELDHTVLLIDADLRRPALHSNLGIDGSRGLSDCLLRGVDLGEVIIRTDIGKLSVIPAGREVQNPLELFSSQMMKDLINEIKSRYNDRYVIFDTPPLLPFAEARSLSHLMDGVIFVIKEGLASKQNIQEALDTIKQSHILGVVFNEVSIDSKDLRYHGYYQTQDYKPYQSAGRN